jgi:hypothetical protein
MTWEERGLRRADGTLAAKPGTQGERNSEWVRLYREEGLSFPQIARRTGARTCWVRDTVTSWFARQGIQGWRRCGAC